MTAMASPALLPPFKVKARYGWSGQSKRDLGFLEGDIMEVTRVSGEWYYGKLLRNRKCAGYFPNNFVIVLEEKINEHLRGEKSHTPSSGFHKQDSEKMGSIPEIPSRMQTGFKNSSEISNTYAGNYSSRQNSSPHFLEKHPRKGNLKIDTNLQRLGEPSYSSSAPDLYGIQNSSSRSAGRRTTHGRVSPLKTKFKEELQTSTLPPLPPLPDVSKHARSNRHRQPVKSHSSNDIPLYSSREPTNVGNLPLQKRFSFDSDTDSNFNSNSSGVFSNSKYLDSSLTDSENSFALMSDFSATSAGSFARHKHAAQSFTDSLQRSNPPPQSAEKESNEGNKFSGLFRKFMQSKPAASSPTSARGDLPKLPTIQNLNVSENTEARDWVTVKSQLNRSRTLTKYEKHPRYMRALDNNRDLVLHPQDGIYNGLNTNEVRHGGQEGVVNVLLTQLNCDYIDAMTRKRCIKNGKLNLASWAQMTFSARYQTDLDVLRGLYIFCCEMFELIDDNNTTDFSCEPRDLDRILYSRYCTPYQLTWLFKKLASSLNITCEIVIGFLKIPDANNSEFKYNHCWLRTLVNGEWRFIDVILGNRTNPIHEFITSKKAKKADDSYFLVEPLEFIYTHVPPREFEQHIIPSLDQLSVLYLPLVFPSFFKNELRLCNYSTALSFLEDTEIFECSLEIPNDIEVFTSVVVSGIDESKQNVYQQMELSLCQIKKHRSNSGRRIALIKAVLPPGVHKGTLYIHSGVRGTQPNRANIHPLSMIVPLEHEGSDMKYEFVIRSPSEQVQRVEMYIKEPQNRYLYADNDYKFEIFQTPFDGIITNSEEHTTKQPMAIRSPSGKVYEIQKNNLKTSYGSWTANIKVNEPGIWTALVVSDSGLGWCRFAEWLCI
ncbi:Cyk3p KNAG_0A05490 [Huiozyma naganishii CBS 8797]|uniref:SH3 domain-containing protein n=1 Tax=Huiozyma naganishii (strain ATCC MYA-139 / BCRC 22969 / CBS 8797 / KCTC 17520 / NBRC 10181 / NCYC 3082 / Yp74L-3) TaxID=1071383 RepID=J7S2J8_HUIN7|nr:hypothetical protein KNAG_0A05490 [Kazachstania naganishii CBS 8797]CCK68214.1 hypothetical protein KNAG_0A05490 [Kazachstania naganishii CBS 8797]